MTLPLDNITVVSLEHAIAAPFATRQLADMGARVIKLEIPPGAPGGDDMIGVLIEDLHRARLEELETAFHLVLVSAR